MMTTLSSMEANKYNYQIRYIMVNYFIDKYSDFDLHEFRQFIINHPANQMNFWLLKESVADIYVQLENLVKQIKTNFE